MMRSIYLTPNGKSAKFFLALAWLACLSFSGCVAPTPAVRVPRFSFSPTETQTLKESAFTNSANFFEQVGTWLVLIGVIVGVLTRFRTGWGLSLAASGVCVLLLAWAFNHSWLPWLGLSAVVAYVAYKVYNRASTKMETERLWQ